MPVKFPSLSEEVSITKEENPVETIILDSNLNTNGDWENLDNSTIHNETEHDVSNRLESSNDNNNFFEKLAEDIECDTRTIGNPYSKNINYVYDGLKYFHYGCIIDIKISGGWPNSLKSLRFYQFCNMNHEYTYQSDGKKIMQKLLFYGNKFESNVICRGSVLDNSYEFSENVLFYTEINETEYKNKGLFQFQDRPTSMWPLLHTEHQSYKLSTINKKQDFCVYLNAVLQNREEVERPIKYWEWGYTFERNKEGSDKHYLKEPNGAYLVFPPFPHEILQLPNANDRQFLFQFGNPFGIEAKVIRYPKELPTGYNREKFNEKIKKHWVEKPDEFL